MEANQTEINQFVDWVKAGSRAEAALTALERYGVDPAECIIEPPVGIRFESCGYFDVHFGGVDDSGKADLIVYAFEPANDYDRYMVITSLN